MSEGTAAGIVAVICGADSSVDECIIELCAKRLPRYMIPTRIYHFDQLPLNVNGKIDRRQIAEQLRQMNAPAAAKISCIVFGVSNAAGNGTSPVTKFKYDA